jgi:hypothetical protein
MYSFFFLLCFVFFFLRQDLTPTMQSRLRLPRAEITHMHHHVNHILRVLFCLAVHCALASSWLHSIPLRGRGMRSQVPGSIEGPSPLLLYSATVAGWGMPWRLGLVGCPELI